MSRASEREPNDAVAQANDVDAPVEIVGTISGHTAGGADADLFRFSARAGEPWVIEVDAARSGSKLDSFVEVLDSQGRRIERVLLQAVRDSYFTFRGKDDTTVDDFRLFNWEEMHLNEYLYANGEVVKLWLYPRGPDSGFLVYPGAGEAVGLLRHDPAGARPRRAVLHRPAASARDGADPQRPAGLPALLRQRRRVPPRTRQGLEARVHRAGRRPVPGEDQGRPRLRGARLQVHADDPAASPGFPGRRSQAPKPPIVPGGAQEFKVTAKRIDGFDGPIRVEIDGLPPGLLRDDTAGHRGRPDRGAGRDRRRGRGGRADARAGQGEPGHGVGHDLGPRRDRTRSIRSARSSWPRSPSCSCRSGPPRTAPGRSSTRRGGRRNTRSIPARRSR